MGKPDPELHVAVAHRILTELRMLPFHPLQLTPDGRLRLDDERLAAWLATPIAELLEQERKAS